MYTSTPSSLLSVNSLAVHTTHSLSFRRTPSPSLTQMGKASKWFRAVLGLRRSGPPSSHQSPNPSSKDNKRRWSFVKSYREKDHVKPGVSETHHDHDHDHYQHRHQAMVQSPSTNYKEDSKKQAVAVGAAAEVFKLTSSGRYVNANARVDGIHGWREDFAAVKIQAVFRGYLARRALRALKALVRLQALVRGHIERKRTAEWLHRMQALLKAQARARAGRVQISESSLASTKSAHFHHTGPPTPEKFEHPIQLGSGKYELSSMRKRTGSKSNARTIGDVDKARFYVNWSERRMDERSWEQRVPWTRTGTVDDEMGEKILEIDSGKPHCIPKRKNLFHCNQNLALDEYSNSFTASKDSTTHQTVPSPLSSELQSLSPLKFPPDDEAAFCTAENSPQFCSASSRGGSCRRSPFTPNKSDGSASFLTGYSEYYPSYMSYTESSRAKVRSLSAPKQRLQYERSSSGKRYPIHGFGEPRSSSAQRASALHASFTSKAYPGSGCLDRLGMPIGQRYYD